jgi:hypothetical protein
MAACVHPEAFEDFAEKHAASVHRGLAGTDRLRRRRRAPG